MDLGVNVTAYERAGFRFVCFCDTECWERMSHTAYDAASQRFGDTDYYWEEGCVWHKQAS